MDRATAILYSKAIEIMVLELGISLKDSILLVKNEEKKIKH